MIGFTHLTGQTRDWYRMNKKDYGKSKYRERCDIQGELNGVGFGPVPSDSQQGRHD
jgi:hypothetical protein